MGFYLESILSGEALVAVIAGKRLHGQVNTLMTLEVVVSVEGLRAHVALEGAFLLSGLTVGVHVVMGSKVVPWVAMLHVVQTASNKSHLSARVCHVRENGSAHGGRK